jgi:hypothetical protein
MTLRQSVIFSYLFKPGSSMLRNRDQHKTPIRPAFQAAIQ